MLKPKISILVPIYNVEEYLGACLDSLVGQTLKEIEIICIDDGSTDGSSKIVERYQKKDKRVIMLKKQNSGYGDSMNQGLMIAKGKFIGIVEPDDFVELNMFEKMYEIAERRQADVVKSNFYLYVTGSGKDVEKRELFLKKELDKTIDPRKNRHIFYQQPSIWSAIYKKSLLDDAGVRFLPSSGASYQDAGFNFKVFAIARKVVFIDDAFLHYRQDNPNSSVKSASKVYAVEKEYDEVERFLKEKDLWDEFKGTFAVVKIGGYIWNMRRLRKKVALEFAETVEKSYNEYKNSGQLIMGSKDDEDARFIANNFILRHPKLYVRTRWLYEMKDMLLRKMWKIRNGVR